jgi:hypothetical protein
MKLANNIAESILSILNFAADEHKVHDFRASRDQKDFPHPAIRLVRGVKMLYHLI